MAWSKVLAACAVAVATFNMVERSPAFVAGARPAQAAVRRAGVQMQADASGLMPGGPLIVYTDALIEAAAKKEESVAVTKDMMKIKDKFADEEWLEDLTFVVNELGTTEVAKADGMIKMLQPLESTVVPKFITFLAKKKRLLALKPITQEYVSTLYQSQSIEPVVVKTAQRLSDTQKATIVEKMKAKTGASDIKLVEEVDMNLLGGMVVQWGFTDPVNLDSPTEGIDLSLKNVLEKAALNKGVVTTV